MIIKFKTADKTLKLIFFLFCSVIKEILRILTLVGQILFSLAAVFFVCLVLKTYLIGPYYRKLHVESKGNKEILILGISAFMFFMLMVIFLNFYIEAYTGYFFMVAFGHLAWVYW